MSGSRTFGLIGRAVIPGLLVAIALSSDQVISVQLWIAAGAIWVAGVLLWDFIGTASIEPARLNVAWRQRQGLRPSRQTPTPILALGALLGNARRNPRAHVNKLRPHLRELADHFVPLRHGFDPAVDPGRMIELLGADSWLIDPEADGRTPTSEELHRFLDVILDEPDAVTS
jgi:hypothetical protein